MDLIKDQYNMFYKEIFLKQMVNVLERLEKEHQSRERLLKAVKEAACFILKKKKMNPAIENTTLQEIVEACVKNVDFESENPL
jgi:predicted transcriptional regulator